MKALYAAASVASLAVCVAAPVLYLRQDVTEAVYKNMLLAASVTWFIFATLWVSRRRG